MWENSPGSSKYYKKKSKEPCVKRFGAALCVSSCADCMSAASALPSLTRSFSFQIYIVYNKGTGKPRGYAFIEYEHERDMHCEYGWGIGHQSQSVLVCVDQSTARHWCFCKETSKLSSAHQIHVCCSSDVCVCGGGGSARCVAGGLTVAFKGGRSHLLEASGWSNRNVWSVNLNMFACQRAHCL